MQSKSGYRGIWRAMNNRSRNFAVFVVFKVWSYRGRRGESIIGYCGIPTAAPLAQAAIGVVMRSFSCQPAKQIAILAVVFLSSAHLACSAEPLPDRGQNRQRFRGCDGHCPGRCGPAAADCDSGEGYPSPDVKPAAKDAAAPSAESPRRGRDRFPGRTAAPPRRAQRLPADKQSCLRC